MKSRTLVQLVVALVILGALAWWSSHRGAQRAEGPARGSKVLQVADFAAVAQVEISSGTQKVTLARSGESWVVASLWNHPAQFDELSSLIRRLADLKVGEVIRGGAGHLAEFGLGEEATLVRLLDAGGGVLAEVALGHPRAARDPRSFSMPDSQFARVGEGPVLLAAPYLDSVPKAGRDWLNRRPIDVAGSDVASIELKRATGDRYGVSRDTNGQWTASGSLEDQPLNTAGAEQWTRALQGFVVNSLVDPQSDRAALGLDAADVTTVQTRDGLVITATVGGTNDIGERYARFSADVAADAGTSAVAQATSLQASLNPWTYVISASAAQSLAMLREQLIAATTTNAPAGGTASPEAGP